ncbi:MAG TPA: hypothetical protein VHS09_04235 [Polyangiaceae bacterium]|jgi:hypothetical protein|nr:hypothetical protein [Polyangiaceae bacterium]
MRKVDRRGATLAVLCMSIAGVVGCAAEPAMAPPSAAPAAKEEREPATIEEAQAQLERARAEVSGETTRGPSAPGAAGATVEAEGATTTSEPKASGAGAPSRDAAGSRCGNACGAVGSMRRAVDAICRMAGETDARCAGARRTLKDSEAKVADCGCPAP